MATWAATRLWRSTAFRRRCSGPASRPTRRCLRRWGSMAASTPASAVAHAMQGPMRKWRPRIVLLTAAFGLAAASHIAALPVAALIGLAAMLWVAEGRRAQVLPVVLVAVAGALVLVFACYGFSPDAFSYVFRSAAGF